MDSDHMRVRFDEGETGWARKLGKYPLVIIDNVPLTDKYCLGDIVELLGTEEGLGQLGEVVHREYAHRTAVIYEHLSQFHKLCCIFEMLGGAAEGGFGPSNGKPGMMMVAHSDRIDPIAIAEGCGINQDTNKYEKNELDS